MKNNNFTQALKELTGFDITAGAEEKEEFQDETRPDFQYTHITSSMVIEGNIKSADPIVSEGQILGDVTTTAGFSCSDLMVGNLKAQTAKLDGCRFKGEITLEEDLKVMEGTVVIGNVACSKAAICGKIKGNLDVSGSVILKNNALISGDIVTDDIATEPGTRINGRIYTRSESLDFEAEFDFGGAF